MRSAYFLFDVAVLAGPAVLAWIPGPTRWREQRLALVALLLGGAPWVAWDLLVAGHHWDFNPLYVTGSEFLGLPLEEWGFFLAVPFACLFSWERLAWGPLGTTDARWAPVVWAGASFALLAPLAWALGAPAYTALALGSVSAPFGLDLLAGGRVFHNPRAWAWLALVAAFTVAFNNVLTGLPIVTYEPSAQLGLRLFTMPIEDLGFGLGHLGVVLVLYEGLRRGRSHEDLVPVPS